MTMTRTPAGPSPGHGTDSGHRNRGPGIAGVNVRLTAGPDGGRVVRALTWARTGDPAPAGPQPKLAGAPGAVPIRDFDGRPAGILALSQLAAVPPERRDKVRLSEVATPLAQVVTTSLDEPMQHLLGRLSVRPASPAALHTAGHALVLRADGSAVGVLTPADFARASQLGALRTNRGKAAGR